METSLRGIRSRLTGTADTLVLGGRANGLSLGRLGPRRRGQQPVPTAAVVAKELIMIMEKT